MTETKTLKGDIQGRYRRALTDIEINPKGGR